MLDVESEAEIAWIDVETTGDDARPQFGNKLLQVAVILTDKNFNEIDTLERKFYFPAEEVKAMRDAAVPFVQAMHDTTGLWDQLSNVENPDYEHFDQYFTEWLIARQPQPRKLRFGGNSIFLDREFMREHLSVSYKHFHYRSLDMTSVEEYFGFTEGRPWFTKKKSHDAMDDIRESIASARYHAALNKPF